MFGACARRNVARACDADSVRSGAACAGAAVTSARATPPTARDNLIRTLSPCETNGGRRRPPSEAGGSACYSAKAGRFSASGDVAGGIDRAEAQQSGQLLLALEALAQRGARTDLERHDLLGLDVAQRPPSQRAEREAPAVAAA